MRNKYLEKIATIVDDTQASSDITPTQPGPNSFPENGQSSEDEDFNQRGDSTNEMPNKESARTVNDPVRLSDRILRHIADTYGPERDPDKEERFDPIAFIEQIKAHKAVSEVDQVNQMDPDRSSEGPNGTSSEEGISEISTRY